MKLFVILDNSMFNKAIYRGLRVAETREDALKEFLDPVGLDAVEINSEIGNYIISVKEKETKRDEYVINVAMSQETYDANLKITFPRVCLKPDQNLVINRSVIANDVWAKMFTNPSEQHAIFIEGSDGYTIARHVIKDSKIDGSNLE